MTISITLLIILFTALLSYQGFNRYDLIDRFKHYPVREAMPKEYYRLFTSGFLHANWVHLGVNMYVLWSFGSYIESYILSEFGGSMGRIIFIFLYLFNIAIANLPTAFRHRHNYGFSSIGASGAVSGFVFMFILLNPWSKLSLFFVINIPAIIVGVAYLAYSTWAARHDRGRLDHSAHFAGAVGGMLMLILLRKEVLSHFFFKLVHDFPY